MKKILSLAVLLLGLLLVGCGGKPNKITASITIEAITPARTSVHVSYKVNDEHEEITPNTITGRILQDNKEILTKNPEPVLDSETEEVIGYTLDISGLKVGDEYTLEIYGTINKKLHVFIKETFKTSTAGSSPEDPKILTTVDEFFLIETDPKAYYKLANDLDFEGKDIPGLFIRTTRFEGHLDGDGHTLKNISISDRRTYTALFGRILGSISNLNIDNMTITLVGINKHSQYISFLVGRNNGTITNVNITNSKIETHFTYTGRIYIGGIAGYSDVNSKVVDSSVDATFNITSSTQTEFHLGGLVGYMNESALRDSSANVIMNISNAYKSLFGGAVGLSTKTNKQSEIVNTIAKSVVNLSTHVTTIRTDTNTKKPELLETVFGGLVAKSASTRIASSIAQSNVTLTKASITAANSNPDDLYIISGFVGLLYNGSTLDNTYHDTTITTNVQDVDIDNAYDALYLTGNVGFVSGSTLEKSSGKTTIVAQRLSPIVQLTPSIGQLINNYNIDDLVFETTGDAFSGIITYDETNYTDQAVLITDVVSSVDLTPVLIEDYYSSDFIKAYLANQ
ncbi:MAG: hypothetical protein WC939_01430 [Acholeplasmataceae bacterium]